MSGATQALTHSLKTRSLLLVLDNCEHLVDACRPAGRGAAAFLRAAQDPRHQPRAARPAGRKDLAGAAAFVAAARAPGWRSRSWRRPTRCSCSRRAPARPARLSASAKKTPPGWPPICRRLDGLPLALELAAARIRVLSVEQIAERLDDTFRLLTTGGRTSLPRQKTLRGAFDWSHDLLAEEQRVLLRRLSVFVGGFSLEAVEQVASGGASSTRRRRARRAGRAGRPLAGPARAGRRAGPLPAARGGPPIRPRDSCGRPAKKRTSSNATRPVSCALPKAGRRRFSPAPATSG